MNGQNGNNVDMDRHVQNFDRMCRSCGNFAGGTREDVIDHRSRCLALRIMVHIERRQQQEQQEQRRQLDAYNRR